jgi:hypothetical protein
MENAARPPDQAAPRPRHPEPVEGRADSEERAIANYVMGVVMPLWIASGSIDYVLHKRSRIEATSGTYESVLHAAGISMSAVPVLAGLFLEIDAGVLLAMIAGYVAHAGMTIWDVAYASEKRDVVPTEQHVHGMLEFLPFAALSFMLVAYRRQALALVGRGERPRFAFRRKRTPLPAAPVAATIAAFTAFVALPYVEELVRCMRYERPS